METLRRFEEFYSSIPIEMVKSNPELKAQLKKLNELCSELAETDDMDTKKIIDLSVDIRDLIIETKVRFLGFKLYKS